VSPGDFPTPLVDQPWCRGTELMVASSAAPVKSGATEVRRQHARNAWTWSWDVSGPPAMGGRQRRGRRGISASFGLRRSGNRRYRRVSDGALSRFPLGLASIFLSSHGTLSDSHRSYFPISYLRTERAYPNSTRRLDHSDPSGELLAQHYRSRSFPLRRSHSWYRPSTADLGTQLWKLGGEQFAF
jgi:hypothetical protein